MKERGMDIKQGQTGLYFKRLQSGGLITNYHCSSKCGHCVYASSPSWPKDYMTPQMAEKIFCTVISLGCHAMHIGGGEPLLSPEKLFPVLKIAQEKGVHIEYIETNSSWYKDPEQARRILLALRENGVDTLLVSIDPYHNAYVPFYKVKGVMSACEKTGMEVFPWRMSFWQDLSALDDSMTHSMQEYLDAFGEDYMLKLADRYGLNMNGRALKTYKPYMRLIPVSEIIHKSKPCRELAGVSHFHADLYGNYVPQSCPGFAVELKDLGRELRQDQYPLMTELYQNGVTGLYQYVVRHYGYKGQEAYAGKCDLCNDIRSFLVQQDGYNGLELKPTGYYHY